ncbi:MAG: hypothetical protein WAT81_01235 [Candidatus Moraniibacteriota bacterium]
MALSFVQRADIVRLEPSLDEFVQVIGVDHQAGAPADPRIRFRPIYGGAGKTLTLSEFNRLYPEAVFESRDDTVNRLH